MKDNKPSQTAVWIAKGLLYLNQISKLPDDADSKRIPLWQNAINLIEPGWLTLLQKRVYRCWFGFIERMTIPGLFKHYATRKKIIDTWAAGALEKNTLQVIVLAAGFDTLTQRYYPQYKDVQFIEIDHPATQAIKKAAFLKENEAASNVVFVAADFQKQALKAVLAEHCSPDKKTLLVAEGITMYFNEQEVKEFFTDLHDYFNNEFWIIFTFMEKQPTGSIQFANASLFVNYWLKKQNELFKWGIEPPILGSYFLVPLGYQLVKLVDPSLEIEPPKTQGEWICLAKANYD
jgi:methyltransferase (TIGR00027 family)